MPQFDNNKIIESFDENENKSGVVTSVIMFRLKERNDENRFLVKEKLLSMKGVIKQLKDIKVEANQIAGSSSFDIVMIAKYDNMDDFNEYASNPFHLQVGKFVLELCEQTGSVIYEK